LHKAYKIWRFCKIADQEIGSNKNLEIFIMEICPKCGLPQQACVCEQIVKSSQKIKITTDKKKFGKIVTIVVGFESGMDVKKIAKALKNELACGGTFKNNVVELQGDHRKKIKPILIKLGFGEDSISE